MGFFSFIENFFFLSLAITFVLILLLVYHFKQRITSLEQKNDTMFEIANGLVKEVGAMKGYILRTMSSQNNYPFNSVSLHKINETNNDDVVEEEEDEDEEYDDEDEEEDDDEEEEENEEDIIDEEYDIICDEDVSAEEINDICVVNDDAENGVNDTNEDEEELKIVEVSLDQRRFETAPAVSSSLGNPTDNLKVPPFGGRFQIFGGINEIENDGLDTKENELRVNKIETDTTAPVNDIQPEHTPKTDIDSYKKMSVHQLKAFIIEKGYTTDFKNLKRNDLIKIIEDNESK